MKLYIYVGGEGRSSLTTLEVILFVSLRLSFSPPCNDYFPLITDISKCCCLHSKMFSDRVRRDVTISRKGLAILQLGQLGSV